MSFSQKNNNEKMKRIRNQIILFAGIALLVVISNLIVGGSLLTFGNLKTIISHAIFPSFVTWGMMFIFTSGIIDLSIGANILLSANVGAIFAMDLGMGYFGLIFATILCTVVLEQLSVNCSVSLKIPSWISGLGMALVFEAILTIYATIRSKTEGSSVITLKGFRGMGTMPLMAIVWIVGFIIAYLLFNRTTLGLNIRAIGGNEGVADAMGIDKKKTILLGALVGAVFIGLAAVIQESYAGKLSSQSGLGSLSTIFKSLATVLLAGSFERIISMPVGIMVGSVFITGLFNVLTLLGVPSGTGQEICLGGIVILCGIISHWGFKGVVK
ncbi:MAG TPA: ABC transporter permease [Clostridiales bacterium]|nr:ABC transporter permease [Clostridiales bacterium]